jgi:hypothetical protein
MSINRDVSDTRDYRLKASRMTSFSVPSGSVTN